MVLPSPVYAAYRAGSALARSLPLPVAEGVARALAAGAAKGLSERRLLVERNLGRADPSLRGPPLDRAVRATFGSYGRYWLESFRLPGMGAAALDATFTVDGYHHIQAARDAGAGAVLALPHLGGWEWAAAWLCVVADVPVATVVEPLEPPELFEWFVGFRRSFGVEVAPLGPAAGTEMVRALRANRLVCLLCDRDLLGGGVAVDFFGERTTLPGGPATLSLRTGAPLVPTAVYFRGRGHLTKVGPPLAVERQGGLRDDVVRITQYLAYALEDLIRAAPDQWHLMSPNWPSDHEALGRHQGR